MNKKNNISDNVVSLHFGNENRPSKLISEALRKYLNHKSALHDIISYAKNMDEGFSQAVTQDITTLLLLLGADVPDFNRKPKIAHNKIVAVTRSYTLLLSIIGKRVDLVTNDHVSTILNLIETNAPATKHIGPMGLIDSARRNGMTISPELQARIAIIKKRSDNKKDNVVSLPIPQKVREPVASVQSFGIVSEKVIGRIGRQNGFKPPNS